MTHMIPTPKAYHNISQAHFQNTGRAVVAIESLYRRTGRWRPLSADLLEHNIWTDAR